MIRKSYPFNLSYHLGRHVYHAAASLPSGKPSSGTWRQIQHTVSTFHYTPQRTQSTHKMMTLCDTRREPNDSYPIPRVIFKERPSLLIPTPTQRRWLIIEREAWAIIFAISLRLLTTCCIVTLLHSDNIFTCLL